MRVLRDRHQLFAVVITVLRECRFQYAVQPSPCRQYLGQWLFEFHRAIQPERDPLLDGDADGFINHDPRHLQRRHQLRMRNDTRTSPFQGFRHPFVDVNVPTGAIQHVGCEQPSKRTTDDDGGFRLFHLRLLVNRLTDHRRGDLHAHLAQRLPRLRES